LDALAKDFAKRGNASIPEHLERQGLSASAITTLISACADLGDAGCDIAAAILHWLWATGRRPSLLHYHAYLKQLGPARRGSDALAALADMRARGLAPTTITHNLALRALRDARELHSAMALLDAMAAGGDPAAAPDLVSYNTLLAGCHREGDLAAATALRARMRAAGLRGDAYTYSSLIALCERCQLADEAFACFREMEEEGVAPTPHTFNALVGACRAGAAGAGARARRAAAARAEGVLAAMRAAGVRPDVVTYNALLSVYLAV
jgi:pentatricopeptide repeat protein